MCVECWPLREHGARAQNRLALACCCFTSMLAHSHVTLTSLCSVPNTKRRTLVWLWCDTKSWLLKGQCHRCTQCMQVKRWTSVPVTLFCSNHLVYYWFYKILGLQFTLCFSASVRGCPPYRQHLNVSHKPYSLLTQEVRSNVKQEVAL